MLPQKYICNLIFNCTVRVFTFARKDNILKERQKTPKEQSNSEVENKPTQP